MVEQVVYTDHTGVRFPHRLPERGNMKILIGYSRDPVTVSLLRNMGHEAYTCDLLPSDHEYHIHDNIENHIHKDWDWAIFHPMCTYLTCSAAWAYNDPDYIKYPGVGYHQKVKEGTLTGEARRMAREAALYTFKKLLDLPYPKAIENPAVSFVNKRIRPPDQIIHPYQFGDDASKATGLWLDRLPKLKPTKYVEPRVVHRNGKVYERWSNQTDSGQNKLTPSDDRWLQRSATYPGIAKAFAEQWGNI